MREDLIEAVEIALILYERGARQVVEIFDTAACDPGAYGIQQRQIFLQCHRQLGRA